MYRAGSIAEHSFRGAMAVAGPPRPNWGWAAEVLRTTGRLPRDDTEHWFPKEVLAQWFHEAQFELTSIALQAAADDLLTAKSQLFMSAAFHLELHANALPQRGHAGPSLALQRELKAVASGAERLRAALAAMRGEVLLQRANGEDSTWLEAIHILLHQGFHEGQIRRQLATGAVTNTGEFNPGAEIGAHVSAAPTWLEDGLALLHSSAEVANDLDRPRVPRGRQRLKVARDRFVQDVAGIWWKATGVRPRVQAREDQVASGRRSAFQKFHEHVCGHTAGLYVRDRRINWSDLSPPQRNAVRDDLRSLGLCNISPATLAQLVRGIRFDPPIQGSKSTPDKDTAG